MRHLTLFTAPKPAPTAYCLIQRNALQSWQHWERQSKFC